MWKFQPLFCLLLLCFTALTDAQGSGDNTTSLWKTLDGKQPLVVARGGFSGLFPDSSILAYKLAGLFSLPTVAFWCDVQLTKDGAGICFPDLTLQNGTDIEFVLKNKEATYTVNGKSVQGWFSLDFSLNDLSNIILTQETLSRSPSFDGNQGSILTVQEVNNLRNGQGLWLNIQHDAFFSQNKLSMRTFILSTLRTTVVDYISSPEVSFLRSIVDRKPPRTKLVFRFLEKDDIEPSTNQTYSTLLGNLTFIKTFASGILVPKGYIWPLTTDQYLLPSTSLVSDAHTAGLQVFAADFSNDITFAYDFSYDPLAEYLKFIDNGDFSVDGVLSDFPVTPSSAIDCFSHIGKDDSGQENPLIISLGGSSGDYPPSTDLAYDKAIEDGADIIDCIVQLTKDGIPICLTSIDLTVVTTAASTLTNITISIPKLNIVNGIPTFNVTWSDIQKQQPFLVSPYQGSALFRSPKELNAGTFLTLSDFLNKAENSSTISGVLISIENAVYLVEEQNLDVIGTVLSTLTNSSYGKTSKKIMIQSSDSAVLKKVKESNSAYELVYRIIPLISTADNSSIEDIKDFAHAVTISKSSVFPSTALYINSMTDVVEKMHAFGLKVYVRTFRNEYLSQAWDFLSDPTIEINSYVVGAEIDGVHSEFPATAARYRKNRCLKRKPTPPYMSPVQPGSLLGLLTQLPPAEAPFPGLTESDVAEPAFPPVTLTTGPGNTSNPAPSPRPNGQPKMVAGNILISWTVIFFAVMSMF
ncbi:glycerophosphodiester phosphodiesterase GDPDL4-like [Impatiens glandulifera]|uniref:glycerophosphodiester phosphodiesterase GDPDL4-like n=1 Tax=Impatiens glandulifera TaxID=253017 RepID=UPI001FB11A21|nr:glycerophosphodiester phosphodiesterase GDPDL4-like [Impatiens glandulifera]